MKARRKRRNLVATLFLAGVLSTAAFAFTDSNTFSGANQAGDGSDTVSGFAVSAIHYSGQASPNDDMLGGVTFTLDPATAGDVSVAVSDDDGLTWSSLDSCVGSNALPATSTDFSCNISGANMSIAAVNKLRVVALG
jgi:hypothetical protein